VSLRGVSLRSGGRAGCAPLRSGTILQAGEGSTNEAAAPAAFSLNNRKYLGAKHRLLDFIHQTVLSRVASPHVFIDGFAGTGVVGLHFRAHARRIVSNDLLYSNYVVNQAFLNSTPGNVDPGRLRELLAELNRLPPRRGYVYEQYGGRYFTPRNAGRIDAVREAIEELAGGRCTARSATCSGQPAVRGGRPTRWGGTALSDTWTPPRTPAGIGGQQRAQAPAAALPDVELGEAVTRSTRT
jgi:hypothetical protein